MKYKGIELVPDTEAELLVDVRVLGTLDLDDEELEERRKNWVIPEPKIKTGYLAKYAKLVSSADKGAILG